MFSKKIVIILTSFL